MFQGGPAVIHKLRFSPPPAPREAITSAKYKNAALDREVVERLSLERLRPRQLHPYWATVREVADMLAIRMTRVRQRTAVHGMAAQTSSSGSR